MSELSDEQIQRQDFVDNAIYQLLQHINPSETEIPWNIEIIADIRDRIRRWFVDTLGITDEMIFYPFIKE